MISSTAYDLFIDIFLYIIDWCILIKLMNLMYGSIPKRHHVVIAVSFCCVFLLALYSHLILPSYINSFFLVPLSFLLLFFYPKNPKKKLLFSFCLLSLASSYLFMLNDITNMLPFKFPWVIMYLIILHVGLWGILFLCLHLCHFEQTDLSRSLWRILFAIPSCTLITMPALLLFLNFSTMNYYVRSALHFVLQSIFMLINILVFVLYRRFTLYAARETEHALLTHQLAWQEHYYQEMMRVSGELRSIRHDMKNHLRTAYMLYKDQNQEALEHYLAKTLGSIAVSETFITTGNIHIDAVLNLKLSDLSTHHITCKPVITIPQQLALSFGDTVTLFGNLLDNALTACLKLPDALREVQLVITYQGESLLIHMENPVVSDTSLPMPAYGIGLKNVEKTAAAYHGLLQTQIANGRYYTDVVLYNLRTDSP